MKIAVIGAGNVGRALGHGWARRGHTVTFGVRDPFDKRSDELKKGEGNVSVATNGEATRDSEVVVFCTPWNATQAAVESCGNLAGKIVIDATNPLKQDFTGLALGFNTSGAEQVAGWAKGAQVYKAMNQIGFKHMDGPHFEHSLPVMFVCGDGDSKTTVLGLVRELGFEAVDAGSLHIARLLEPYAMLWIHLALVQGLGQDFGFALLRKSSI